MLEGNYSTLRVACSLCKNVCIPSYSARDTVLCRECLLRVVRGVRQSRMLTYPVATPVTDESTVKRAE